MILIDTSIWIDHYRAPFAELTELLGLEQILQHPFVTAELALGNPSGRSAMVARLDSIDQALVVTQTELLDFVAAKQIGGTGLGFVDAHLLASAERLNCLIWCRDKRLATQAERLGRLHPA